MFSFLFLETIYVGKLIKKVDLGNKKRPTVVHTILRLTNIKINFISQTGCSTWCCRSGQRRRYPCLCCTSPIYQKDMQHSTRKYKTHSYWAFPYQGTSTFRKIIKKVNFDPSLKICILMFLGLRQKRRWWYRAYFSHNITRITHTRGRLDGCKFS